MRWPVCRASPHGSLVVASVTQKAGARHCNTWLLGVRKSEAPCHPPCVRPLASLEYLCHVYVRNDSLAGVVIADSEYPSRVAFTLLEKVSLQPG